MMPQEEFEMAWSESLKVAIDDMPNTSCDFNKGRSVTRLRMLAAAAAVAAVVGGSVVATNAISSSGSEGTRRELMPARSPEIHTSNSRFPGEYEQLVVQFNSLEGRSGFGKVVVSETAHEITVYWKGDPPAEVLDLIGVATDGTRTSWTEALHSREEIEAAGKRVMNEIKRTTGSFAGASISATEDLGGLVLTSPSPIDGDFERVAGMPVRQVRGEAPADLGGVG